MKATTLYVCGECGSESPKWLGRCPACRAWNSLMEDSRFISGARQSSAAHPAAEPRPLAAYLEAGPAQRIPTGIAPMDRVLGGGLVPGMGILIGGEPGIGKSTLLLQCAAGLARRSESILYVTGEESGPQVALRAHRLGVGSGDILLLPESSLERVLEAAGRLRPAFLLVDSIQTLACAALDSPAGSLAQVRECAARLLEAAKRAGTPLFLVGHVTKEGTLAGPKALEHLVDTVLYFDGDSALAHRLVRCVKNRFGPAGEVAVFEMVEEGLRTVENASALFLGHRQRGVPGSVVFCSLEGSLPILVEIQALVAAAGPGSPRRSATGLDPVRVSMILAILEKRAGVALGAEEVYVNAAGGVRLTEVAADLPAACAVASSALNRPARPDTVAFGELGLVGEIRSVPRAAERLREAHRMGFIRCVLPRANLKDLPRDLPVEPVGVSTISEAMESLL
jgi:DNA repair protein RadA/Sms